MLSRTQDEQGLFFCVSCNENKIEIFRVVRRGSSFHVTDVVKPIRNSSLLGLFQQ